jgi:hypothetical protein
MEPATIVWEAEAGACVTEGDFRAAVAARLGATASTARTFRIQARKLPDGQWLIFIREGAAERRQQGECEAAFSSAALAVAVAIDPLHADARPAPLKGGNAPPDAVPTSPSPAPSNEVLPQPTEEKPPLPRASVKVGPPAISLAVANGQAPAKGPASSRYGFDRLYGVVEVGGGLAVGRTPRPAPVGRVAVGVVLPEDCGARSCLPKGRLSLDFGYLGTTEVPATAGGVAVAITGYEIGLSGRFGLVRKPSFSFGVSGKFAVFASAAAGRDVADARRAAAIGAYVGGGAFVAVPVGRRWEFSAEVLGGGPLRRTVAALGGGTGPLVLWTSGPLIAGATANVSFSFR